METIKAILTRRSIRQYTGQNISKEIIDKILRSAMYAPSAFNKQPWEYIVVEKRETLDEILKIIPHAEMLKQAMAAILVCGDKNIEENIDLIVEACSAATQNALLTVHDLGLGAVWISAYPVRETVEMLKSLFKYPENIIPISLISIGYPAEKVTTKERFNPGKVHYNVW